MRLSLHGSLPHQARATESLITDDRQRRTGHRSTMVTVILGHGAATGCDGHKDGSPLPRALQKGRGERCADHFLAFAAVFTSFFVAFFAALVAFFAAFSSTFFAMATPFE